MKTHNKNKTIYTKRVAMMEDKKNKNSIDKKDDDLWSRIKALAEKEDISYLEATERCVREYWKDYGLKKES